MEEKKCNICGYPGVVEYREINPETGAVTFLKHKVNCVGHSVFPEMWNRHPEYQKYKQFREKQKKELKQEE